MENYLDIHVPSQWMAMYESLSPKDKVALYEESWGRCTDFEHSLIIADLQYFFMGIAPPSLEELGGEVMDLEL